MTSNGASFAGRMYLCAREPAEAARDAREAISLGFAVETKTWGDGVLVGAFSFFGVIVLSNYSNFIVPRSLLFQKY